MSRLVIGRSWGRFGGRFWGRFWALVLKELRQIRRDRRLVISLILPPALQVLLFGFALDAEVRNMRLGVVDESRTAESRELVSVLTENRTFRLAGVYPTTAGLAQALGSGQLDVGVVVPYDFAKLRARGRPVTVQILLNGVNANTAQNSIGPTMRSRAREAEALTDAAGLGAFVVLEWRK